MPELYLIARLAGRRVAFPADAVEAVVEIESITPTPRAAPHVAGLAALRSRVLTVIDSLASLEFGRWENVASVDAIVVLYDGHPYALMVEEVVDVVEVDSAPAPISAPVGGGWDRAAIGTIINGAEILLLIEPGLLIVGPAAQAA